MKGPNWLLQANFFAFSSTYDYWIPLWAIIKVCKTSTIHQKHPPRELSMIELQCWLFFWCQSHSWCLISVGCRYTHMCFVFFSVQIHPCLNMHLDLNITICMSGRQLKPKAVNMILQLYLSKNNFDARQAYENFLCWRAIS